MMRQIPAKIWLPVIAAIVIAVGLAVFFTLPREEKAPEVIAPKVMPPQGIVWNVPTGQVDPEVEREIKRVIYNDPYFVSLAEDLEKENEMISFETLEPKGKCAVIGYAFRSKQTKEFLPTAGVTLILKNVNGKWEKIGSFVYDVDYSECEE